MADLEMKKFALKIGLVLKVKGPFRLVLPFEVRLCIRIKTQKCCPKPGRT